AFGSANKMHLSTANFPLDAMAPLLQRFDSTLALDGIIATDLTANWNEGFANFKLDGTTRVQALDLAASWLRGDRLRLAMLEVPLKIDGSGSTLKLEQAAITCDFGKASIEGEFQRGGSPESYLDRPGVTANVTVDLAKLVHALPKLTSLRAGTQVRTGSITLA